MTIDKASLSATGVRPREVIRRAFRFCRSSPVGDRRDPANLAESVWMNESAGYALRRPRDEEEWRNYHAIRRRVLFENRGQSYDEHHPDEFLDGNYPLVLLHQGEPIGVIRIDVDASLAIFRRVAIRNDVQRRGHGRAMLALAETFARDKGCNLIRSFVNPEAVGFYERCGFSRDSTAVGDAHHISMIKRLTVGREA